MTDRYYVRTEDGLVHWVLIEGPYWSLEKLEAWFSSYNRCQLHQGEGVTQAIKAEGPATCMSCIADEGDVDEAEDD